MVDPYTDQKHALEPCPFCGGNDLFTGKGWLERTEAYVHCSSCGAHMGRTRGNLSGAIKAWNSRADADKPAHARSQPNPSHNTSGDA